MAKPSRFETEGQTSDIGDEDKDTLAAIDEGISDAQSGRTVSPEEVRTRLPKWITTSFTRKGR